MKLESLGKVSGATINGRTKQSIISVATPLSSSQSLGLRFALPPHLASSPPRQTNETTTSVGDGNSSSPDNKQDDKEDLSFPNTTNFKELSLGPSSPFASSQGQHQICLPAIILDVEQIVGYKPSSVEEVQMIREQMMTAMWQRYRDTDAPKSESEKAKEIHDRIHIKQKHEQHERIPPPDFDDQIVDLLHAKMARFSETKTMSDDDTQKTADDLSRIILQYPPQIQPSVNNVNDNNEDPMDTTKSKSTNDTTSYLDTAELWKDIDRLAHAVVPLEKDQGRQGEARSTPKSPWSLSESFFLKRLTKHLKATSQPLLWKHAMAAELESMARSEHERLLLDEWTTTTRGKKLEHLYSVRETLIHQEELARYSYDTLYDEREAIVRQKMLQHDAAEWSRQQRFQFQANVGEGALIKNDNDDDPLLNNNFGTSALDFPEEFRLLGIVDSNRDDMLNDEDEWSAHDDNYSFDDHGDDNSYDHSDSNSDNDSVSEDGYENDDNYGSSDDIHDDHEEKNGDADQNTISNVENSQGLPSFPSDKPVVDSLPSDFDQAADTKNEPHVLSTPFQKRQERRRKMKLQKRQERREAARRAQAEKRKEVEAQIRAQHSSNELILAETFLRAIESKVKSVDDLLESLQDEVWEAEEDEDGDEKPNKPKFKSGSSTQSGAPSLSLLDQILAMILGGLPLEPGMTEEEHFAYIKHEHVCIVNGWERHFGRLPPPIGYHASDNFEDVFAASTTAPYQQQEDMPTHRSAIDNVTAEEQRLALGIVDNNDDEWDASTDDEGGDDDDDKGQRPQQVQNSRVVIGQNNTGRTQPDSTQPLKPQRTGLRPGGRVRR